MRDTCVAFLGGRGVDSDEFYLSQVEGSSFIVAVDSGAETLMRLGLVPDLLVGDMDSISDLSLSWCLQRGTTIRRHPEEKDETDTELALRELKELGYSRVILLNFDGNRPDHFLGTLMVMYALSDSMTIEARSSKLNIGIVRQEKVLDAVAGEVWSIIPVGPENAVVSLEGFKYSASNMEFPHTKPIGISNVALSKRIKIHVSAGAAAYFRWISKPE